MEALKSGITILMYPDDSKWHDCEGDDGTGKLASSFLVMDEGRFYYDDFNSLDHPAHKDGVKYRALREGNKFTCTFWSGPDNSVNRILAQYRIDNYTGDFMPKEVIVTGKCKFKPNVSSGHGVTEESARPKFPGGK
ncbi:hypothetical protein CALCODRAFT_501362 [Calocera cornea HHB12733]|uniref:Uncharacterized protein n=1 Tax=Calocera cornea HHB12733 TaxID=1353952 RepID=A0A165DNZ9_9BASI|nr:hypothetical protein CALCODRAFT_501362 [Calocera cornea HHB12733]